jgi:hypothetical protein
MTLHQNSIPEPIAQLQQQLTQWRGTNPPRMRLPESFWNSATELARQYGLYQTAHVIMQVKEVGSGAAQRNAGEKILEQLAADRSIRRWCGG